MYVKDHYENLKDFEELLDAAEENAFGDWQVMFVERVRSNYREFRSLTFITEKQIEVLKGIANCV